MILGISEYISGIIKTLKADINIDMKVEQIDRMQTIGSFKNDDDNGNSIPTIMNRKRFCQ